MSLTINSNQASSIAWRSLRASQNAIERALSKLSSGQRAPSARDDAAAVAIGSRIRGEIVSLQKYSQNAQQATSMLQIAEGAYQRTQDMLVRMRGLASQAQSGNLSNTERGMLNTEYAQLKSEITRIAKTTNFSGLNLFDVGNISIIQDAVGYQNGTNSSDYIVNGDFNGDGYQDILSADSADGKVTLSLGRGDGTFGTATTVVASNAESGYNLKTGDFNGDGKLDFAYQTDSFIRTFTGNGNGVFSLQNTISAIGSVSVAVADFNNDGMDDLAYTNSTTVLRVCLTTASGYTTSTYSNSIFAAGRIAVGDFDNNGYIDIVSTDGNNTGIASNSGGGFSVGTTSTAGSTINASRLEVYDMNNDGNLDIIIPDSSGNKVYVFNGNGNGGIRNNYAVVSNAAQIASVTIGDYNGDGFADIMIYDDGQNALFSIQGTGIDNTGTAQFANDVQTNLSWAMYSLIAADFNRDGKIDFAGTAGNLNGIVMNQTTMGLSSNIRVGANAATANNVAFRTGSIRLNSMDNQLEGSTINSIGAAKRADESLKRAMQMLALFRTSVGAATNRLEKVQENIATMMENQESARSSYLDLDVASEMAEYTSKTIIQQAGISMLTQANQSSKMIAKLLDG